MEATSTERVLGLSVYAAGDEVVIDDASDYYFPTQDHHLRTEQTEADEMYWRATQRIWEAERGMNRRPQ